MASLSGKDILIVDDARDIRMTVRKILETDGATVYEAGSVDQALDAIQSKSPQVIFIDLDMPVKSGFDFLTLRQSDPKLLDIPTLVLSGMNDAACVRRAIGLGATDYILKPFRATQLLQKTRKCLKILSFNRFVFPVGERPAVQLALGAEVIQLTVAGFTLESSIKIATDETIGLECEALSQGIDLSKVVFRTTSQASRFMDGGRYLADVGFAGGGDAFAKSVRAFMKEWK